MKVAAQLDSVVSVSCLLAIFKLVLVTIKITEDLHFRLKVVLVKVFQYNAFGLGELCY